MTVARTARIGLGGEMTNSGSCTCWQVVLEDGGTAPARWVSLHDEVRLTALDGTIASGWTYGPDWWGPAEVAEVCIEVESNDRSGSVAMPMENVLTLTPVSNLSDASAAIRRIGELVDSAASLPSDENFEFRCVLDAHTTIEISLRKERHKCLPGRSPYSA